jgi:hypothetical protein
MASTMLQPSLPMKIFDACVVIGTFLLNTLMLAPDWQGFAIAAGGSFTGSITLVYYRREASRFELFLKLIISTLAGFVLGTVIQEYMQMIKPAYQLGLFFICGMSAVAVCRAVLNNTETNAEGICRALMQRVFPNYRPPAERLPRGKRTRPLKKLPDGRFITLPPTRRGKDGEFK